MTKGDNRPVNSFARRSDFLNDLHTVDKVFLAEDTSKHGSEKSMKTYRKLLKTIKPTHIFTHKICDKHWKDKMELATQENIICIVDKSARVTNSGNIIKKLELDF